ncbi:cytochrome c nitrite reductase small subunit [Sulfurospirillum multivorans]|uniref:Cytochrome c-type protein n=2 Tax=Sulfurospirillum multivorans TaxID=66821 RepID=A0AA86E346_SULMK|nr:cytochrome c nitrite reductase small subunit [Sulfurospirillum multivorans]AHJ13422.1 cytochrome c-type protein NrfH [Sulfurospirillum multivorans DSM 12446]QEH06913.1 cytochrome c-type protein NrfH [Sulfurospirillum multivorans]
MDLSKIMKIGTLSVACIGIVLIAYTIHISNALSYLTNDPKACINCHVMNTHYATWQHSSHARNATCADCHLPRNNFVDKYIAKAKDGLHHAFAFTFNLYTDEIKITKDGADRVQKNCIECHPRQSETVVHNNDLNHQNMSEKGDYCWRCHRDVPHGLVRGLNSAPNNLGVKEAIK